MCPVVPVLVPVLVAVGVLVSVTAGLTGWVVDGPLPAGAVVAP
jgi:hypothetical protein